MLVKHSVTVDTYIYLNIHTFSDHSNIFQRRSGIIIISTLCEDQPERGLSIRYLQSIRCLRSSHRSSISTT
jgi:hypothetical protein